MSIKIGSLTIADTYFGSSPISAIYQGSNLIWQRGPVTDEPFYVTSDEAFTIQLTQTGTVNAEPQMSSDKSSWMSLPPGVIYDFQAGQKIYIRNIASNNWSLDGSNCLQFITGCTFKTVGGNAKSLINNSDTLSNYCFCNLFQANTSLQNASELILPWMTLAAYCYHSMFYDCTSLISCPALPATTLAAYCYTVMFNGCTALTSSPALPATTLADYCYYSMFGSCTSLETCPALPATTLRQNCYSNMFYDCTSLISCPALPATTLANYCYSNMFNGCTSLTSSPALPATTLAYSCYSNMFFRCSSLETCPALPATTLANYCYNGMFQGCRSLTQLPALPATTLANYCYRQMFYQCTNIKLSTTQEGEYVNAYRIPTTGTGTTATGALQNMFGNTGGTFTGAPSLNTTYYTSNEVIS